MKKVVLYWILSFLQTVLFAQFTLPDKGAIISAKVQVDSGEILFSQHEQLRLIPASLTKIVTTATVLELLGSDYLFKTYFYYAQESIVDGVLKGNIYVVSGGDPTLGSKYFEQTHPDLLFYQLVKALKNKGIVRVEGDVVVESDQISLSAPRLWEDMGNYYGASPKGFNWKDNTVVVTLQSGLVGSLCKVVEMRPKFSPYKLDCRVKAASHNKDSAYVYGTADMRHWWIEGSIPANRSSFTIKAAMPNPILGFKDDLVKFMRKNGIDIQKGFNVDQDKKRVLLFEYKSPFLSEIIKVVNHRSNNLFADQLLLTLAKEKKGKATWDNGNAVVREFWKNKIDFEFNFRLRDGSGLTPKNLISAKGMVQLLCWMKNESSNYPCFANSLAVGGESGTLHSVFKHPTLNGRVKGKSGSMEGVLGYCGYLTTLLGKQAAFCVIANNFMVTTQKIRQVMDAELTQLILEN